MDVILAGFRPFEMILSAQTVLFTLIFVRPHVMNITVTITVLQNASKCTISKEKIPKFSGEGAQPPPWTPPPSAPRTPSKPHFWLRAWLTLTNCSLTQLVTLFIFNHQYGRNIQHNKKNKINLTRVNHNWAFYHTLSSTQFSITEIHNTIVIAYNRKYASLDG